MVRIEYRPIMQQKNCSHNLSQKDSLSQYNYIIINSIDQFHYQTSEKRFIP